MDGMSDRIGLPLLNAGQAQKELCHNEALTLLDIATQCAVESAEMSSPPADPAPGLCWIVPAGASGAWSEREGCIAGWTQGGWRFLNPREGMTAWCASLGGNLVYRTGAWSPAAARADGYYVNGLKVVGARRPAIADPVNGAIMDVEARAALAELLAAARAHGLIG